MCFYVAQNVGEWHEADMTSLLRDVRFQGQSRKHLLALSFSSFDPTETLAGSPMFSRTAISAIDCDLPDVRCSNHTDARARAQSLGPSMPIRAEADVDLPKTGHARGRSSVIVPYRFNPCDGGRLNLMFADS